MFTHSLKLLMVLAGLLLFPFPVKAEPTSPPPVSGAAWGAGGSFQKLYETGTRAKVVGKVMSMTDLMPGEDEGPGVQVKLDLGGGKEMDVHLGPRWFVLQQELNLTNGQPLVVEGISIHLEKHPTLIANEVTQGERKVILRELSGAPKWEPKPGSDTQNSQPLKK